MRLEAGLSGAVEMLEWAEHAHAEVGEEGVKRYIEQVTGRWQRRVEKLGGSVGA